MSRSSKPETHGQHMSMECARHVAGTLLVKVRTERSSMTAFSSQFLVPVTHHDFWLQYYGSRDVSIRHNFRKVNDG